MDKEVAKRLFRSAGLPVVEWLLVRASDWARPGAAETLRGRLESGFGYPCFIKPGGLGSSVGVSRATDWEGARRAVSEAMAYDEKVLVERAIDAREIEVAVLGNDDPAASVVGEIVTTHSFYDYEAKYHDDSTRLLIPAPIPEKTSDQVRAIAIEAFRALELAGLARVDFLLDRTTGEPYLNEVNTLPGFTPVSMYPKLWQASGVGYTELINRLIGLAFDKHRAKHALRAVLAEGTEETRDA
jgi:D-alanine-D-alanine ligase